MSTRNIETYLQDHLAGATAALGVLDDLIRTSDEQSLRQFFEDLKGEITSDRDELVELMQRNSVPTTTIRSAVAWIAEKATMIKARLDSSTRSDLLRYEAVELLSSGIEGKRALWTMLADLSTSLAALRDRDYTRLIVRAVEQRQRLEPVRLDAGRVAFREGFNFEQCSRQSPQ